MNAESYLDNTARQAIDELAAALSDPLSQAAEGALASAGRRLDGAAVHLETSSKELSRQFGEAASSLGGAVRTALADAVRKDVLPVMRELVAAELRPELESVVRAVREQAEPLARRTEIASLEATVATFPRGLENVRREVEILHGELGGAHEILAGVPGALTTLESRLNARSDEQKAMLARIERSQGTDRAAFEEILSDLRIGYDRIAQQTAQVDRRISELLAEVARVNERLERSQAQLDAGLHSVRATALWAALVTGGVLTALIIFHIAHG